MSNFDPAIQFDEDGDPYVFNPGDMGKWERVPNGMRNAETGEPFLGRREVVKAIYTGGRNSDGSWTLAKDHT